MPQALPKPLPRQMRPNGELLEQVVTVDMSDTRNARAKKNTDLRNGVLHVADIQDHVKQPASYAAGLKDAQQAQHWKDGDAAEWKRIKDSSAATIVPYEEAEQAGDYIGHIIRVIKVKEVTEKGVVVDREYRVRWAYDEPRDPNEEGEEHFAAVMRSETSRLLNLKARTLSAGCCGAIL